MVNALRYTLYDTLAAHIRKADTSLIDLVLREFQSIPSYLLGSEFKALFVRNQIEMSPAELNWINLHLTSRIELAEIERHLLRSVNIQKRKAVSSRKK